MTTKDAVNKAWIAVEKAGITGNGLDAAVKKYEKAKSKLAAIELMTETKSFVTYLDKVIIPDSLEIGFNGYAADLSNASRLIKELVAMINTKE